MTPTPRPVTVRCPFCEPLNKVDLARLDAGPRCGGCGRPLLLDRPVRVTATDFDRDASVSERFGIRGIPTVIGFRNGVETGRLVGLVSPVELDQLVTR